MELWQNIPLFSIILCLLSAAVCSVLKKKASRIFCICVLLLLIAGTMVLTGFMADYDGSYTFMMGHFPAPWGNEIRVGMLECVLALFFMLVMLLSVLGGGHRMDSHVEPDRHNLYYVMIELLTAALLAQIYSNDLFTSYVFVEIMTIAACSLITARTKGKTLVAATRYMVMNLLGSGLFLLGVILLYDLTGHLLMSNIQQSVAELSSSGRYAQPLTAVIALLTLGLGIKSALYPFHSWVPDAYSAATPSSAAILSSLVSKGYIVLLIKINVRVIGMEVIRRSGIDTVLFVFSIIGILMGSVHAIRTKQVGRMIAFSSVAQIGYIYLGISMGTNAGMVAAVYHIIAHAAAKSMLFLGSDGLRAVSHGSRYFPDLRGSGKRAHVSGAAFTLGTFAMVGIPFTGGFVSKLLLMQEAALMPMGYRIAAMLALGLSTLLNVIYFLHTVITIYRPALPDRPGNAYHFGVVYTVSMILLITVNLALGILSGPLIRALMTGIANFA